MKIARKFGNRFDQQLRISRPAYERERRGRGAGNPGLVGLRPDEAADQGTVRPDREVDVFKGDGFVVAVELT